MLEIKNLNAKIGNFSLENINLSVKEKACHVIVGKNGSGKTTFLECILGIRKVIYSQIYLNNMEITKLPIEKRGFAYIPQDLVLFSNMSVEENINFIKKINPYSSIPDEILNDLYEELNLRHHLKSKVTNLSGGEKQKVAILRAIASGRRFLLLDEPFSSLDLPIKHSLWNKIKDFKERFSLGILLVTHDIKEAYLLGDSLSVMCEGSIYDVEKDKLIFFDDFVSKRNLNNLDFMSFLQS
jgi:ABC-type sugar transport system ATPase subunit